MQSRKLGLVGGGQIGGTIAHLALLRKVGDVVLFDINVGVAKGKALDLMHSAPTDGFMHSVIGTDNYEDLSGCDVVIVTAGLPRKPGMTRDDLIEVNLKVMSEVGAGIAKYCPEAFVICVTNPLDAMVWCLQHYSGISDKMICGMSGILDSSRFKFFLAEHLNVSWNSIDAYVLGGHGDTMVPLTEISTVAGVSLNKMMSKSEISRDSLNSIIERTKFAGGEIVKLFGNGSAYYAPATAALQMALAYLNNTKQIFSCAVKLNGEYGVKESLFVGVPAMIGGNGIEKVIELELTESEQSQFDASFASVVDLVTSCKKIISD